jgi:hypothetical protein
MDFISSLFILAVFLFGFGVGYCIRALISAKHRRRHARSRGFPLAE